MTSATTTTKTCRKCDLEQPASAFSADSRNLDGLQAHCRKCRRLYVAEKRRVARDVTPASIDATSPEPSRPAAGSGDDVADSCPCATSRRDEVSACLGGAPARGDQDLRMPRREDRTMSGRGWRVMLPARVVPQGWRDSPGVDD